MATLKYLARKTCVLIPIFILTSLFIFILLRYGPGDPVAIRAGQRASEETVEQIRHELGLDRPVYVQYGEYMSGFFRGGFGESISKYPGVKINKIILPKIWVSAQLGLFALLLTFSLGIPLGILSALAHRKWLDPLIISSLLFFASIPVLILIPILQYILVLKLHLVPASGWSPIFSLHHLPDSFGAASKFPLPWLAPPKTIILPLLALSLPGLAGTARFVRILVLGVLDQDYVRTAKAKGLSEFIILRRHVMPNALLPLSTAILLALAGVAEGAFFTETLYGIPGIGRLSVESVFARDYDMIMAISLLAFGIFLIAMLLRDVMYGFLDPRVKL